MPPVGSRASRHERESRLEISRNLNPKGTTRVEVRRIACDDVSVPLSEDEQRILRQIEQELEQDPTFAARGYRVPRRRLVLLSVALILGLLVTVLGLTVSYLVAFAGFLVVLFVAVLLEAEIRVVGRDRLANLPISAWLGGNSRSGLRD